MKLQLKNIRGNYNKEERLEEDKKIIEGIKEKLWNSKKFFLTFKLLDKY